MKFVTEKKCWHNGKYYEEGDTVECNCSQCKEGKVSYFKKLVEDIEKIEEVVKEDFDNAIEKVDEMLEIPVEEELIECKDCKAMCGRAGSKYKLKKCKNYTSVAKSRTKITIVE